jgi:amino-acid N-acetyltransferase
MCGKAITLQQADDSTLSYIETLLEKNGLPSQDVQSQPECFYIGYNDAGPVGIGGIEIYESDGLLRSVVIEQATRGCGWGTALCDALEANASADDVDTLYLLTTTAADFFDNREYVEIERANAPTAIQQTTEFDNLCPTTATCMKKSL